MEIYNTTKETLIHAAIPIASRTYKPVSHSQLIDLTLEGIEKAGFTLDKELYTSAREGMVANGRYTIKNVADSEMQLQLGFQNSYNKSLSLKYAIGTQILICKNGCVSGDFGAFKKKHAGEIQTFTPVAITEYIKRAGDTFELMQKQREEMKQIEITKTIQAQLLGQAFIENQFITSTQLNIIKTELSKPTYDYKAKDSMWELMQFVTFSMKDIHPSIWMKNHIDAHKFFTETSEIISIKKELILPIINQLELFEI